MPFSLALPRYLAKAGWKVKIQDKESRETPHMTVWFKKQKWRVSLRDGRFMDAAAGTTCLQSYDRSSQQAGNGSARNGMPGTGT